MKAVGVWFRSRDTGRYLYLLRNDTRHPGCWALPGGKVESGETLLGAMERECVEELGEFPIYEKILPLERFTSADGQFEYNTWVCVWCNQNSSPGSITNTWAMPGSLPESGHGLCIPDSGTPSTSKRCKTR